MIASKFEKTIKSYMNSNKIDFKVNRSIFASYVHSYYHPGNSYIFLTGSKEVPICDEDMEYRLVKDSNFSYFFGINEPNIYGAINVQTKKSTLIVDLPDPAKAYWMKLKTIEEIRKEVDVEEVVTLEEFIENLEKEETRPKAYAIGGNHITSGVKYDSIDLELKEKLDKVLEIEYHDDVAELIANIRRKKTQNEIIRLRLSYTLAKKLTEKYLDPQILKNKTEKQISLLLDSELRTSSNISLDTQPTVLFGKRIGVEEAISENINFQKNYQAVFISVSPSIHNYSATFGKTLILGELNSKQSEIFKKYEDIIASIENAFAIKYTSKVFIQKIQNIMVSFLSSFGCGIKFDDNLKKVLCGYEDIITSIGMDSIESVGYLHSLDRFIEGEPICIKISLNINNLICELNKSENKNEEEITKLKELEGLIGGLRTQKCYEVDLYELKELQL